MASCGGDVITLWSLPSLEPLRTLRTDRPYERLDITGVIGISEEFPSYQHRLNIRHIGPLERLEKPGSYRNADSAAPNHNDAVFLPYSYHLLWVRVSDLLRHARQVDLRGFFRLIGKATFQPVSHTTMPDGNHLASGGGEHTGPNLGAMARMADDRHRLVMRDIIDVLL